MEQMIPLTIDGVHVEVPAGTTVLEAARIAKVNIPTLCYLKDINETANCRLCVAGLRRPRAAGCLRTAGGAQHGGQNQHPACARRAASIWS